MGLHKMGFPHHTCMGSSKCHVGAKGISSVEFGCTTVFNEIEKRLRTLLLMSYARGCLAYILPLLFHALKIC